MFSVAVLLITADILVADFEGTDYGSWTTTGTAFGTGPARGAHQGQMAVIGYRGHGLVNSYLGGDQSTGTLTSSEFKIERPYIKFLLGGGKNLETTYMALLIDGNPVRTATGPNARPGGSEALRPDGWDVREFVGKTAKIQIVDQATGGWGHINVDHIVQTDRKPPMIQQNPSREVRIDRKYLLIPIKRGAPQRRLTLEFDGLKTSNSVPIADAEADWWAFYDVSKFKGGKVKLGLDEQAEDSKALTQIKTADSIPDLYDEPYRPRYRFTSQSGWLNDPNGLAYFNGEWHMFFQHDPVAGMTEYKYWGHAVSKDLVHWRELPTALYADELGSMWSGGAVVDHRNDSGFGEPGKPALLLFYTAAGVPSTQCLAYSTDGRTFTKFKGNPILPEFTGYNRDPKVEWHEPSRTWIMTLYVERNGVHCIEFFRSTNLWEWHFLSRTEGFYECPDFFEMTVEGTNEKKWVLSAANTNFMVGEFDGERFIPETPILTGNFGTGYYAPQTFSDAPDGRRIQVGWMWTNPPESRFTQCMSIPMELKLVREGNTYRVTRHPIPELDAIAKFNDFLGETMDRDSSDPLSRFKADASVFKLKALAEPGAVWKLNVRGTDISFDADKREITVGDRKHTLNSASVDLEVFVDRLGLEVFANGDYIPLPSVFPLDNLSYSYQVTQGKVHLSGKYGAMRSIWK